LFFLPHNEVSPSLFATYSFQTLLAIVSFNIAKKEPVKKNKLIFVNFGLFFSMSISGHLGNFIGTLMFQEEPFARMFYDQFLCFAAYFFTLAVAIVYLTVDALLRERRSALKYLITFVVVGTFFGYYYHPYFLDPKFGYKTADVLDLKALDDASNHFRESVGRTPTPEDLAGKIHLQDWSDPYGDKTLSSQENRDRIEEIYPYLEGNNYLILVWKPMYMNSVYMSVLLHRICIRVLRLSIHERPTARRLC